MRIAHKFQPDIDKLTRGLTGDVQGARRAGFINVVTTIEARAKKNAPVKTSNLANTGTSDVNADATKGTIKFTAPYAGYVHQGTGLYGPHKTKIVSKEIVIIRPKTAKGLFWPGAAHPVKMVKTTKPMFWPGMKHPVPSTKGMKRNPFLLKAYTETDIPRTFTEGANHYLAQKGGQ